MGEAYECDKCGRFFPGEGHSRFLPSPRLRDETAGSEAKRLQLCIDCKNEFDTKMYELNDMFKAALRRRAKNGIRSDKGHDETIETT